MTRIAFGLVQDAPSRLVFVEGGLSKVLLRVGPEHAAVIKQKLREIRAELVKTKTP